MITASLARSQGRPLFALPGRIDVPTALGPLELIRQGAKPIVDIESFLIDFGALLNGSQTEFLTEEKSSNAPRSTKKASKTKINLPAGFSEGEALTAEEFSQKMNLPISQGASQLMMLEIEGKLVKRMDGRYEAREKLFEFQP